MKILSKTVTALLTESLLILGDTASGRLIKLQFIEVIRMYASKVPFCILTAIFLLGISCSPLSKASYPLVRVGGIPGIASFEIAATEATWDDFVRIYNLELEKGRLIFERSSVTVNPRFVEGCHYPFIDFDAIGDRVRISHGRLEVVPGYERFPVSSVSWLGAVFFCNFLSESQGLSPAYDYGDWTIHAEKEGYRLPTFDEWQFAAKGGTKSLRTTYSGSNVSSEVAWFDDTSGKKTHRVATKKANELGLFDMSGNVNEWCADLFRPLESKFSDSESLVTSNRVYCGGSFLTPPVEVSWCIQIINRNDFGSVEGYLSPYPDVGFRVARSVSLNK